MNPEQAKAIIKDVANRCFKAGLLDLADAELTIVALQTLCLSAPTGNVPSPVDDSETK